MALAFLVAFFLVGIVDETTGRTSAERVGGMLAGAVQGAALWWRRSHPQVATAIALAGGFVMWSIAPDGLLPFAGLIAVFTLAATRMPRISLCGLAGLAALTALNFETASQEEATFVMVFAFVAWVLGEASRRAVADASRRHRRLAPRGRRRAGADRARAARRRRAQRLGDRHPGGGRRRRLRRASAQARAALRSIEGAGSEAPAELRRLLAAVRPDVGEAGARAGRTRCARCRASTASTSWPAPCAPPA